MSRLFGFMCNDADRARCALELVAPVLKLEAPVPATGDGPRPLMDGYGIGFYQNGEVLLKKRPLAIEQVDFLELAKDLRTDVLVGHVRAATIGNLKLENTHPFRFRSWIFAHNGTLARFAETKDSILASIPDFLRRNIRGDTDSEHIFHLFLAFLHDAGKLDDPNIKPEAAKEALASAFGFMDRLGADGASQPSVLNTIATNGRIMLGTRRGLPMYIFRRNGIEDCAVCRQPAVVYGGEPKRINHDQLRTVVLASEPSVPPGPGWEEVPERTAVLISRDVTTSMSSLP